MNTKKVNAKVNLSLAIVGKKDNLHLLDMIFYPVESLFDEATFIKDDSDKIVIEKIETELLDFDERRFIKFINDKLEIIYNYYKVGGKLLLKKNVPLGAGIGGSSTMIAAVLKAIEEDSSVKSTKEFLLSLGSDVPYMMIGGAAHVKGVGDIVEPIILEDLKFDILFIDGGVDTKLCYKAYDDMNYINNDIPPQNIKEALTVLRNDLFVPACDINKSIKIEYDNLVLKGYKVVMTGSGSALVYFK